MKDHFIGTADARKIGLLKNLVKPTQAYPIASSLKEVLERAIDENNTPSSSGNQAVSKKYPTIQAESSMSHSEPIAECSRVETPKGDGK